MKGYEDDEDDSDESKTQVDIEVEIRNLKTGLSQLQHEVNALKYSNRLEKLQENSHKTQEEEVA
jgi:hypothetical protein